jgi:hypothetical protein
MRSITYVIYSRKGAVRSPHFSSRIPESFKCLLCLLSAIIKRASAPDGFLLVMSLRGRDVYLRGCQSIFGRKHNSRHANVKQNSAILLFLDNMVLEDPVVQGLRWFHDRRHGVDCARSSGTSGFIKKSFFERRGKALGGLERRKRGQDQVILHTKRGVGATQIAGGKKQQKLQGRSRSRGARMGGGPPMTAGLG